MPNPIVFNATTPRLSLPLLFAAQAQKELFHNEALVRIDAMLHAAVEGCASSPPVDPNDGESWLITAPATGPWAGQENAIATFQNGGWVLTQPLEGMRILDKSAGQSVFFISDWQKAVPLEEPSGGQNVDSQARAAIGALISALRAAGIYPPA